MAVFPPAAVAVFAERPHGSPRNVVPVRLAAVEPHGDLVRLRAGVRDGGPAWADGLAADVTPAALVDLPVEPGAERSAFRSVAGVGSATIVGAFESSAQAVSLDGSVVVGFLAVAGRAQRGLPLDQHQSRGRTPRPRRGAETASALGVTANGATVVGWGTTDLGQEVFIWDPVGGTRSLRAALVADGETQLTGWTLTATGISPDGKVIVGYGISPQGQVRAWEVAYECYANCDESTAAPLLNVAGLPWFLQKFGMGDRTPTATGARPSRS